MTRIRPSPPGRGGASSPRSRPRSTLLSRGAGPRGGQVGGQGARLRPRRRDEPVRLLRLRPPRQGLPLHPRPLLPGDLGRQAGRDPGGAGAARDRRRRRRLHRGPRRLRAAARPRPPLRGPPAAETASACGRAAASCWRDAAAELRAAGRGRIRIGGVGAYRGALEVVPTTSRGGIAERDQRGQRQPVREGRRLQRDAVLVAAGGAADPGRRQPLLRALGRGGRQRLRPLRRHQQPGLRRHRQREQREQPGRLEHPQPGRPLQRRRSPRPSSSPARAGAPRASSTSSSAIPSPT